MFRSSVPYAVIGVVAKERDLSVQVLHKRLLDKWLSVSLPNFYKVIAHMVDDQILIRPRGRVQLHALFMRYIFWLNEDSQKVYRAEETNSLQKLEIWQQECWEEANLYDLNVIRADLLGQLSKMHADSITHHYCSHPYYLLCTPQKEQFTLEEFSKNHDKSYFLIGNNTLLDRYGSQLLSSDLYKTACVTDAPFPEEGYIVDIIGDYIIECMFPKTISDHFAIFFQTISGIEWYNKELFTQVLKMKALCSVKVIHSPEHAKKMRAKIEKAFRSF